MRAMIVAAALLAFGVAACGGEVIVYSPTATREPACGFFVADGGGPCPDDDFPPLLIKPGELREPIDIIIPDNGVLYDERLIVADKLQELREWTHALDEGSTSRAELVELCTEVPQGGFATPLPTPQPGEPEPIVAYWRTQDDMLGELCGDVLGAPSGRTLREWADLIEARFGGYEDFEYDYFDFGEED
jgi:hypothetical protein